MLTEPLQSCHNSEADVAMHGMMLMNTVYKPALEVGRHSMHAVECSASVALIFIRGMRSHRMARLPASLRRALRLLLSYGSALGIWLDKPSRADVPV